MNKANFLSSDLIIFITIFILTSFFYILTTKNDFVSSVEKGRYALTRSIVEDKTLNIDKHKDFSAPDLSQKNGHFYSRFPAGMSFIMTPFQFAANEIFNTKPYIIQFVILAIIAAFTISLFYIIGRLGDFSKNLSTITTIGFGFGTLIFSFAGGFWSHILSLFFITLSIIFMQIFLKNKNICMLLLLGISYALSISIDFPNAVLAIPLIFFSLYNLLKLSKAKIMSGIFLLLIPIIIIGSGILEYNKLAFGSPFKIGQSSSASVGSKIKATIIPLYSWNSQGVFDDRRLFPGLTSQIISPERGIIFFSPILLFSLLGFFSFSRKDKKLSITLFSIFIINIIFYSLWQDYWGGWSFGPRYLIVSIPALVLPALYLLKYSSHRIITEALFCLSVIFGIFINSLGAFSGIILPCPCEGYIGIWYSPIYAYLKLDQSINSFFFNNFFVNYINPYIFLIILSSTISIFFLSFAYILFRKERITER